LLTGGCVKAAKDQKKTRLQGKCLLNVLTVSMAAAAAAATRAYLEAHLLMSAHKVATAGLDFPGGKR